MKFCAKCGTQLLDEAVICTKCGCMTEGAPDVKKRTRALNQVSNGAMESKPSTSLMVFGFLFRLLAIVTIFFIALSFGNADVRSTATYDYKVSVSSYLYLWEDALSAGFLFSLIALAFALVSFVLTLAEQQKGEHLFAGILKLVAGVVLVMIPLLLLF